MVLTPIYPVANFSTDVNSGYAPLSVQFTDLSENATGWNWDFGDGANSTQQNPIHTFAAGNYNVNETVSNANGTSSMTSQISVQQATPTITWNNPADIVYGTPLSNVQLDASATFNGKPLAGSFVYTNSTGTVVKIGTVLSAGKQTLIASFTPSDSTNYTSGRIITNSITVNQAIPTIIWSNPANITHGTALSNTQLDATGSVPGPISYNPVAGTILGVGTHTLNATLTPTDSANYTIATDSVSLNVTQATPTITWSNPANIAYGTALSNIQLDATALDPISGASVPGFFFYTLPAGDVLSVGQQLLNVLFLPDDLVDYNITSATASINVLGMPDAHFGINQTQGPVPLDVQFTDRTKGSPTSWYWGFGDGTNSTLQNPEHIYNTAGIYIPILTAGNKLVQARKYQQFQ